MKINLEFDSYLEMMDWAYSLMESIKWVPRKQFEEASQGEEKPTEASEPEKVAEPEPPKTTRKRRGRPKKTEAPEPTRDRVAELLIQIQKDRGDNVFDLVLERIDIDTVDQLPDEEIPTVCPWLEHVAATELDVEAAGAYFDSVGRPEPANVSG